MAAQGKWTSDHTDTFGTLLLTLLSSFVSCTEKITYDIIRSNWNLPSNTQEAVADAYYRPLYDDSKSVPTTYNGKYLHPLSPCVDTNSKKFFSIAPGAHDGWDQPLCRWARSLKIDCLIFQHELGKHRGVTEILDTRVDSYSQLINVGGPPGQLLLSENKTLFQTESIPLCKFHPLSLVSKPNLVLVLDVGPKFRRGMVCTQTRLVSYRMVFERWINSTNQRS
jgi:hypothetical protein